jgi:hypothetical protein
MQRGVMRITGMRLALYVQRARQFSAFEQPKISLPFNFFRCHAEITHDGQSYSFRLVSFFS